MTTPPPLGLLLDVDGPIASPVTRTMAVPSIAADLVALANAGVPVAFNTGRSDAFIRDVVVPELRRAGLAETARVYAICEKGAVWFRIPAATEHIAEEDVFVDASLALDEDYSREIEQLVADRFADSMFFDRTKRAMVSVEQHVGVESADYLAVQPVFDEEAMQRLSARGIGVLRNDDHRPDAEGLVTVRVDPTIISTDIESVRVGKDLGAARLVELLEQDGVMMPVSWRTMGDSRSDYAMADWLHEHGHDVAHVDVRPADGVPEKPYPIFHHDSLIHDEAGAVFLTKWVALVQGEDVSDA